MKKIINKLYKTVLVILSIFVLYASYCAVFNINASKENLNPLVLVLGIITLIFSFIKIKNVLNKITEKNANIIAIILSLIFTSGLCFIGYKIRSVPVYDLSNIDVEAKSMLTNGRKFENIYYFAKYTNQIPITVLVYYIYKIAYIIGFSDLKGFATIINSIFIGLTSFFTYLSVKKIKDYKIGLLSLIFFIINPVFYLYASYYYTDTMCMLFAILGFYLFICAIKSEKYKKYIGILLCSGAIFAIGFQIRVVVGILLIGTLMGAFISNKITKELIIKSGTVLLGFLIGTFLISSIFKNFDIPYDKDLEFPPTHWVMMGLNEHSEGIFNSKDHNETRSKKTYSKKVKYNIKTIKNRLKKMGLVGLIKFEAKKISINWSNGGYNYIDTLGNVKNNTNLYQYTLDNKKIFLTYYMQILKASILIILLICLIKEIKNKKDITILSTIYISIFGAFLFYLIWEVKSRYSLSFLPWIIMIFGIGIINIENIINNKIMIKVKNINTIVVILSVALLIINYYNYTIVEQTYYDTVVSQSQAAGKGYEKIADKTLAQTFYTKKSFDCIELKFNKKQSQTETDYCFYLKDKDGNVLFKKPFTSKDIEHRKYKKFEFERINPSQNTMYIIEVNSTNASKDDTLLLEVFYRRKNDSYPDGIMTINGNEKLYSDFIFKVKNKEKRSYVSKRFYILISIIIIIIEIFAFYPYLKYNNTKLKTSEGEQK